jgi:NAD(P)-dependent dehydrogenase (short-subunit alcohol dehydrogenase family)
MTRQRVMITAAAAGIGRCIAEAFVNDGALVHLCDVDEAAVASARADLAGCTASVVDVADADAFDAWFDEGMQALGGLDVFINNAGIKGPTAYVEDIDPDEWRQCLAICLDSHYLGARRAAPVMKAEGSGSIINVSSMAGVVGYGMRTPYAAAKWAVIGLTKSLAVELGPHNVRCNAICPGSVRGERMDRVIGAEALQRGVAVDLVAAEYLAGQSIKRFVEPSEIADLCRFLASPAASMITGQALGIDGHTETYHLG